MKVEIFKLCDFAQADSAGKLTIVGIFDIIHAKITPATHGLCSLVIRMQFDKAEEGEKKIKLSFVDTDGKLVMPPTEAQIQVRIASNGSHANLQGVFLFPQITFPHFGEYLIELEIDGKLVTSTSVSVRQTPTVDHPQTPPQPA